MVPEAREVRLSPRDRKVLEARCRSPLTLHRDLNELGLFCWRRPGGAPGRSPRRLAYMRCRTTSISSIGARATTA
jgi:hypothetical protein